MSVMRRIGNLFTRGKVEREIDAELRAHIEMRVEDNMARGMTLEEARRDALLKFGNPVVMKERVTSMDAALWVENFFRDVRYAVRQLRKSPVFAMTAVLTLALGIGANTAIFSVVNGLLFSSLHVLEQSRLTILAFQQKGNSWQSTLSLPEYNELRDHEKNVFSDLIAEQYGLDGLSMQGSTPDRAFTDYVTGNYFQAQGVEPFLGRFFRPSEGETPGADPVMVLSYTYWKQQFAGDPHVIGRQVSLDGHPMTVIGVAPRNYHGLNPVLAVQAYLPLAMIVPIENVPLADWSERANRNMHLYGRLQSSVTPQQANAALAVVARRFATEHPRTEKDTELRTFPIYLGRSGQLDDENTIGMASALFLGLAGLVLLLACVNVANLLLVRASVREREMVIRSALGAQRARLIRQMLTESILLALLGGAAGIGLGLWGSSLLGSVNLHVDMPIYFNFGFDWHVFAFSAAIALLAGAIVGVVPALRLSRANLNLLLREGGRGVTGGSNKFRDALVMLQVGSALMLLIIAGLFTRSLAQAAHTDLGFNPSHVLTLTMDPSEIGYNASQTRDFYKTLLGRIRVMPGVEMATTAESIPMGMINNASDTVTINGYQPPPGQPAPSVGYNVITANYFRTLQIPLEQGRGFTDADNEKNPYAAIVSESMVKKFWPDQDPIGKQFTMNSDPTHPLQVVGIAKDARYQGVTGAIPPYFYVPYLQHYAQNPLESLELRTAGNPTAMIPEIERTIHTMTPTLPVFEVKTLRQGLYTVTGLLDFQVAAVLAAVMGTLGLILAIIGVYGVLSYVVSQKTNEIGIRMALGAQRSDILKMVYRQGAWIVGIGLAVGLAVTFAATHLMRSFIVVSATDPITYIGVSAILVAIAMLACYIPARRAVRIAPVQALRSE